MREDGMARMITGGAVAVLTIGTVTVGLWLDRSQRALIDGGHCQQVMEVLYTPPPVATTQCYGEGSGPPCSTFYSQADPYLRTLWRCANPNPGGDDIEFWRRSAERHGR